MSIVVCSDGHITGTRVCPMCGSRAYEKIPQRRITSKTAAMPVGVDFQPIAISAQDAQYADMVDLAVRQVCGTFAVPPFCREHRTQCRSLILRSWRKAHRAKMAARKAAA